MAKEKSLVFLTNPLKHSKMQVGTNAYNIYKKGCEIFNWDSSFGQTFTAKDMYAEMTVDGKDFGLWFIGNSNFTEQHPEYINTVFPREDWKIIEEFKDKTRVINPTCPKRVVFLKDPFDEYIFLGVYERINVDHVNKISTYTRIDKTYPSRKI